MGFRLAPRVNARLGRNDDGFLEKSEGSNVPEGTNYKKSPTGIGFSALRAARPAFAIYVLSLLREL